MPSVTQGTTLIAIATLIAAVASALTVVVAAIALISDGRRTRLSIGISNLWRLIEVWDGPDMRSRRALLARAVREVPPERDTVSNHAIDVLNTFELLGYLVRAKVLRLEDAWVNFSAWALSWWALYEPEISRLQQEDPTIFEDYAALVKDFIDYEAQRRGIDPQEVIPSAAAIEDFLSAEEELLERYSPQPIAQPGTRRSRWRWWSKA